MGNAHIGVRIHSFIHPYKAAAQPLLNTPSHTKTMSWSMPPTIPPPVLWNPPPAVCQVMSNATPPEENANLAPMSSDQLFAKVLEKFGEVVSGFPLFSSASFGVYNCMHLLLFSCVADSCPADGLWRSPSPCASGSQSLGERRGKGVLGLPPRPRARES